MSLYLFQVWEPGRGDREGDPPSPQTAPELQHRREAEKDPGCTKEQAEENSALRGTKQASQHRRTKASLNKIRTGSYYGH